MKKYAEYILVLVVFIVLVISIDWANQYMRVLRAKTYSYVALSASVQIIGPFLLGLLIGSLDFIRQLQKDGYWKVNIIRLLVLGLPLFIILAMFNLTYLGVMWPQMLYKFFMLYILTSDGMIKYMAIFLGYIVISSFAKVSGSTFNKSESQVNADNP